MGDTEHSFDIDLAKEIGIEEAIIFKHIGFWVQKNTVSDQNFFDGKYWTYNSYPAFAKLFPYMTQRKIRYAISKLEEKGLIVTGNYNQKNFDQTKWYSLTDLGQSIFTNSNIDVTKMSDEDLTKMSAPCDKIVRPIPDINNTNINTNINIDLLESKDSNCQTDVRRDIQRAVDAWNELEPLGYPKISRMSSTSNRYKMLKKRISEYGIDEVLKAVGNVRRSKYLKDQVWFTFDWFIKPNNFVKVHGGNYNKGDDNVSKTVTINSDRPERWKTCPESLWQKLKPFAHSDGTFDWSEFDTSVLTQEDRTWMRRNDM